MSLSSHLENTIAAHELIHELPQVFNSNFERLYVSLFKKKVDCQVCIVFLHGYGSNRLECSNILPLLSPEMALCSFDFSGSGKSQGDSVTYGVKEKEDIRKGVFT